MATYLNRTPSSASNRKTWTYSTWLKRSSITTDSVIFAAGSGTVEFTAYFKSGGTMEVYQYDSGTYRFRYITNQVFRDPSAWYHIVIACDTTQGSASDRVKIYVNGSQITSFSTNTTPSQNQDTSVNLNTPHVLGRYHTSASGYYLGYMAQTILVDGTALTSSSFGSTNANGIWVPNTSPSVTYGNNGFRLQFAGTGTSADSSGFGADTSGNNNHFTSNSLGTNPNTKDTPHNNFSLMNPLNIYPNSTPIITDGGLKTQSQSTSAAGLCSTMAVSAGKWYAEGKIGSGATLEVGAVDIGSHAFNKTGTTTNSVAYDYGGNIRVNNSNTQTGLSTYTGGDIIGILLNMDTATGTVTFYKNGSAVGSAQNFTTSKPEFAAFYMQSHTSGGNQSVEWNLGNPTFAIASSNADANGYGNFEYAVPSGYYALCTKNLAQYGG